MQFVSIIILLIKIIERQKEKYEENKKMKDYRQY